MMTVGIKDGAAWGLLIVKWENYLELDWKFRWVKLMICSKVNLELYSCLPLSFLTHIFQAASNLLCS